MKKNCFTCRNMHNALVSKTEHYYNTPASKNAVYYCADKEDLIEKPTLNVCDIYEPANIVDNNDLKE